MAGAWANVLARMRSLVERQHSTTPDSDLLQRVVASRDPAAFELLVWRHGLMVLNVCQRLVGCPHTADDAFQAVFLILARKAGSIRGGATLPAWLHRVAVRVAWEAKRQARRHQDLADVTAIDPVAPDVATAEQRELHRLVDEELDRIPVRYRVPLVLSYLEGKSNSEVATELGVPEGTVFSRLARGREKLRQRLLRRGVTSSVASSALCASSAEAALALLIPRTTSVALAFAVRGTVTAEVSMLTLNLAKGVLHTMWLKSCTMACGVILVFGLLGLGDWQLLQPAPAQESKVPPIEQQSASKETPESVLLRKKVDIAKRGYEEVVKRYMAGGYPPHPVLEWSRMWLAAERDRQPKRVLDVLEAHRQRMKEVHDTAKHRFEESRTYYYEEFGFCDYALAEADLWILREKENRGP